MSDPSSDPSPEPFRSAASAGPASRGPAALRGWLRPVLVGLCLVLSVEALATVARWRASRDQLQKLMRESGTVEAEAVIRRISFERTTHHGQLIAARALVYDVLAHGGESSAAVQAAVARLPRARELALEALRQQPNSWEASMFLGAATYLEWSLTSDRRLYTEAERWEKPLLKARRQGAGKPEPRRFLATAYLETWAALSDQKRAFATQLLEEAFREDPQAFARLAPIWLEATGDRERALAIIPDRSGAWLSLESTFAGAREWDSFCLARRNRLEALERQLERDLDEAEERLRLGDLRGSRSKCLAVILKTPRDGRYAYLVTRALELYPPGIHGLSSTESLKEWLSWALELNAVSVDPFAPGVLSRLTDAIGELEPAVGALAALIGGDVYRTERYERLAESTRRKEWAQFLIAKSLWLVGRDEVDQAARTLAGAHRSVHGSAAYWLARERIARAAGDLADLGEAERRLADLAAREWQPLDWRWRGQRVILEMYPEASGLSDLSIEIRTAPADGAVVEVFWDGSSVDLRPVRAREMIELTLDVEARPHLLELRSLAGGEVHPGRLTLRSPSGGT